MKHIAASEFKAKCLAILSDIARTGERVVILKRGKPVAELGPVTTTSARYPQDAIRGLGEIVGDILSPVVDISDVEVERGA